MLKNSTIEKLRKAQSAAEDIWNELMTARENECEGDVVATNEDIAMLVQAAVKMNQAVRLIELLRYRHDADYKRKA
jgi:hypothetical protein